MTDKEFIKKYRNYIVEKSNLKQAIKLLIVWKFFIPKRWRIFREEIGKTKTFNAAYNIANESELN